MGKKLQKNQSGIVFASSFAVFQSETSYLLEEIMSSSMEEDWVKNICHHLIRSCSLPVTWVHSRILLPCPVSFSSDRTRTWENLVSLLCKMYREWRYHLCCRLQHRSDEKHSRCACNVTQWVSWYQQPSRYCGWRSHTWSISINLLSEFEMHIQERQQCKERPFWFLRCTITWLVLFHFSQFPSVTVP